MNDKIIKRDKIKEYSEEIERILRENPTLKNRDKFLKKMIGQTPKRKEILELLGKAKNTEYVIIGKMLVYIGAGKEYFFSTDFYESEDNYYFIDEEQDYSRFLAIIGKKDSSSNENQKSKWDEKLERLKQLKIKIKKNITLEKLHYFFKIKEYGDAEFSIEEIGTENFFKNCELLYNAKLEGYNKNRYEIAEFLDCLKNFLNSRTEITSLLEVSDDKIGDFKILYTLCQENPEKKNDYLGMKWKELKEQKNDK